MAILGGDADVDATRTSEVCLAAAARALENLVNEGRFARDSALELLAIDALTTYAFEYAAERPDQERDLAKLAHQGTRMLGQLTTQRV